MNGLTMVILIYGKKYQFLKLALKTMKILLEKTKPMKHFNSNYYQN